MTTTTHASAVPALDAAPSEDLFHARQRRRSRRGRMSAAMRHSGQSATRYPNLTVRI